MHMRGDSGEDTFSFSLTIGGKLVKFPTVHNADFTKMGPCFIHAAMHREGLSPLQSPSMCFVVITMGLESGMYSCS